MKLLRLLMLAIACINYSIATANDLPNDAKENNRIVFGVAGVNPKDRPFRLGVKVLKEISKRTGYKMELITLPTKRAQVMLERGEIDADLARVKEFSNYNDSLIMVKEPIAKLPFHAYSTKKDLSVKDIKNSKDLRIVAVRGQVFPQTYFKDSEILLTNSIRSGFWFLHKNRADIFVAEGISAQTTADILELEKMGIYKLNPPLAIVDGYTFFTADNTEIAKKYEKALIEIKQEGIYDKIFEETK